MIYKRFVPAGGQALIEGVMMKCGDAKAIALRKSDGTLVVTRHKNAGLLQKGGFRKLPFIRGVYMLIDSMIEGGKDMTYAADVYAQSIEEEKGRFELWLERVLGDRADQIVTAFSLVLSVIIAVTLFILLPTFVARGGGGASSAQVSLREGGLKLGIFVLYLLAMSQMKDIKRVFQYHGAEHKSIFAYERGLPLTVEEVRKMPRLHPRCGTNFMFVVIMISILLYTMVGIQDVWLRSLIKLFTLPVVSGISYELIRFAGKYQNGFTRALVMPGLLMQHITTREPDDDQIEVAIASLKAVLEDEGILETEDEAAPTETEADTIQAQEQPSEPETERIAEAGRTDAQQMDEAPQWDAAVGN